MAEILRDPIWQFIGAVLGLVAISVSIYLFLLQKREKSLICKIETITPLLTVNDESEGKLQIVHEGVSVQNVYILIVKILADGNVPIASSDFEQPLSFLFGETAKVLSADVVDTNPKTLAPKLSINSNKITLEPILLNNQDSATIKVLISEYQGDFIPSARIIGVREIKDLSEYHLPFREIILTFTLGIVIGLIFTSLIPPPFEYSFSVLLVIVSSTIAAGLYKLLFDSLIYKRKQKS